MDKKEATAVLYKNDNVITDEYETIFDNSVIMIQNERILKELKALAFTNMRSHLYKVR